MIEKCDEAGIDVPVRGTACIYPELEAPDRHSAPEEFLDRLREHHGTDFGLDSGRVLPHIRVVQPRLKLTSSLPHYAPPATLPGGHP